MTCGVYLIRCWSNKRVYVGSSTNIPQRWRHHKRALSRGSHENTYLQRAWNKYGEINFSFEVIELIHAGLLIKREQYWMDSLKVVNPKRGFNILPYARSQHGVKRRPEVVENVRRGALKRYEDPAQRIQSSMTAKVWATPAEMTRRSQQHWDRADDDTRAAYSERAKVQWGPGGSLRQATEQGRGH